MPQGSGRNVILPPSRRRPCAVGVPAVVTLTAALSPTALVKLASELPSLRATAQAQGAAPTTTGTNGLSRFAGKTHHPSALDTAPAPYARRPLSDAEVEAFNGF